MAQDTTAPTVNIATPAENAVYTQGAPVTASFACSDDVGVTECTGTVADGSPISTATVGNFTFKVTAKDAAGGTTEVTRNYTVQPSEGEVGGETAATLNLTLGTPAAFAPFVPGLTNTYTTALAATILSTADNATLSVADPSSTATGHLVNGPYWLQTPLQATAASTNEFATALTGGNVGGSAAPTSLLAYSGPATNDVATLTFKQNIAQTEPLRTGAYSKTLTFTLSTTNP